MSGSNVVFTVAKGEVVEKLHEDATKFGVLLLKVVEADSSLNDRTTVADLLAHNTEANFTGYARKTGLTGSLATDFTADTESVSLPNQTWTGAGGATNNTLVKLVVFYDVGGTDATRIPLTAHSFDATTDGSDLVAQFTNFFQAS